MTWTNSIEYQLYDSATPDRFGRSKDKYGACSYKNKAIYFSLLGVLDVGMLCLCVYQAWHARALATEFQETKHILSALLILGGIVGIGVPVVILNRANPDINNFIQGVMTFASCISVLVVIFVPKIRYKENKEPRIVVNGVTATPTTGIINSATSYNGGIHGSVNYGEKILTDKTHRELLTEISSLKRRLQRGQQDIEE